MLYGYDQNALAVYFNQGPILSVGGGGGFGRGGGGGAARGAGGGPQANFGNMQPNATPHQADDARGRRLRCAGDAGGPGGRG